MVKHPNFSFDKLFKRCSNSKLSANHALFIKSYNLVEQNYIKVNDATQLDGYEGTVVLDFWLCVPTHLPQSGQFSISQWCKFQLKFVKVDL